MYYQPMVIYRKEDTIKIHSVIRYIGNRVINNNKNFLCAVTGQTGSGKSWACISMAEIYSKMFKIEFNPDIHIISSLKELLQLINSKDVDRKIKFGSVLVFDEPQIEGNARNWQSETNKALGQLISTFRNLRLVIFFATPFLEMIDKQTRILFHGEFMINGFDKNSKITTIKPRFLEYNKKKNDFYRKRLIVMHKVKGKYGLIKSKLDFWKINAPSKEIINIYEAKKKAFSDKLNKKLLDSIELNEKKEEGKNKSEEFFEVTHLYNKYGEDYPSILKEMPHLTPFVLEKYIQFIKRGKKKAIKRE